MLESSVKLSLAHGNLKVIHRIYWETKMVPVAKPLTPSHLKNFSWLVCYNLVA